MAYCQYCGAKLTDGAKFCTECGGRVVEAQPARNIQNTAFNVNQYKPPIPDVATYSVPKKARGKRWPVFVGIGVAVLAVLAALVMILGGSSDGGEVTVWNAVSADMWDIEVGVEDAYPDGFRFELKENGKCTIVVGKDKSNGKWTQDGDQISISAGGAELEGTITDNVIYITDVMGSGVNMTFLLEGTELPVSQSLDAPISEEAQAFWNGDWYGWWIVDEADGEYADWSGEWWDCCAEINIVDEDGGTIYIWDEDYSRDDPMCGMWVELFEAEDGEVGFVSSDEGYFLGMDLGADDLIIDPDMYGLTNFIGFEGTYEDEDGSFTYYMYLRPWGQEWEDVLDNTYENIPFDPEDMFPYYYEDWYLPAIRAGEPMPDVIGFADETDS